MTPYFWKVSVLQWCCVKMVIAQMQGGMTKYIQMGPTGPMSPMWPGGPSVPPIAMTYPALQNLLNTYPPFNSPLQNLPNLQNLPTVPSFPTLPNLPNFPNPPPMTLPMTKSIPLPMGHPIPVPMAPPPLPAAMNSLAPFPIPSVASLQAPCLKSALDPTVLNNLAIALHLLILSNLMNPTDLPNEEKSLPGFPLEPSTTGQAPSNSPNPANPYTPQNSSPPQQPTAYPPQQAPNTIPGYYVTDIPDQASYNQQNPSFTPPNSKFLGNSGFIDPAPPSMIGVSPYGSGNVPNSNPRSGHSLMSPYDAMAPSSSGCYEKDIFAQYGPQNLKSELQSPYQSMAANDNTNKDLFSMF